MPEEPNVNVYVGAESRCFVVPRTLLCSHSIYCNQILNPHFLAWPRDSIHLEGHEPEAFELLIQWMLSGNLALENFETSVLADPAENALREGCHLLCALYRLCNSIRVVKDEELVLAKLRHLVRYGGILPLEPRTVRMVLRSVSEESTLHEFVLQQVADDLVHERGHDYDNYEDSLEGPKAIHGLAKDLIKRMKNKSYDWSGDHEKSWNLVPMENKHQN